ncbi:hypothetical protein Lfu02_49450 [Longispora fulva]|uniref:Putative transcriptional regulator n=1 Tax=Longispora fulva TaxID=619741 RepID=A0A8J7KLS8_9ACTN|nr:replication-relaxation family protein [Longispora fulva]MBG6138321.1 putative transcriptional regulator [Longispora fulva]GIG60573.1 hypothetical protein Lfu02_49450 [Longispora fulva]
MRTNNTDPLLRAQSSLTDRDLRLADWLYDHGVLTTDQIAAALFPSLDFAQRRLLRLTALGVVARFRPQRWDGGSHPYHYLLDQLGTEIVAAQRNDSPPRKDQARRRRHHLTNRANLAHLLGTNQVFTDLAAYARTHPGTELRRWWPASRFYDGAGFYQRGDNPAMMISRLPRPDGHGMWATEGRVVPFYLEYDTGSEPIDTLVDKVSRYSTIASMAMRSWPVLFWLPSLRREHNFQERLANAKITSGVLLATTSADYVTARGLSPAEEVWWLHRSDGRRRTLAAVPYIDDALDGRQEE